MLILEGHGARVRGLAYAPDGLSLASCGADRKVRLWDLTAGAERLVLRGHRRTVTGVVFSLDGRSLVSSDREPAIRSWDVATGEPRMDSEPPSYGLGTVMQALAGDRLPHLDPEARRRAEAAAWRLDRFGIEGRYDDNAPPPGRFRWSTILRRGTSQRRSASIGDSDDGLTLRIRSGLERYYQEVPIPKTPAGTPYGAYIPGVGFSVIDSAAGRTAAFAPDGRHLAVTDGREVLLWDLDARFLKLLVGHGNLVRALAFAPDGRTLATGGFDSTARLWDVATGRERACFDAEVGMIDAVAFAPDGMTVAAGGHRGIVIWDVDEGGW